MIDYKEYIHTDGQKSEPNKTVYRFSNNFGAVVIKDSNNISVTPILFVYKNEFSLLDFEGDDRVTTYNLQKDKINEILGLLLNLPDSDSEIEKLKEHLVKFETLDLIKD